MNPSSVIFAVLLAFQFSSARELISVEGEADAEKTDASSWKPQSFAGEFSTKYCVAEGKQCPGEVLLNAGYESTPRQCLVECTLLDNCESAFYSGDKFCYLKRNRCTFEELIEADGDQYYRLKKGQSCDSERKRFEATKIKYSSMFCLMRGKRCPGHSLYRRPQNVRPFLKCLVKCAKIKTCSSVDFVNDKCDPMDYTCNEEELVDDETSWNFIRLPRDEDSCGPGREIYEAPPC